ncbi:hypothetical protein SAMN02787142_0575 [Burkholderia sp. WP9]|uniref:hypothetical protein n=1 Tax=Burkholderia sp. WP9 TaxID=1500263 RepID=UPI000899FC5F|nr:hypothetical protein [Burkholderia sp. WP9]SEB92706.1 hypothetical protein SAMN02787142_0575 [Burkholderia sp. WP9]
MKAPDDFPWKNPLLSGSQPKLAGRMINGRFVVGETEEERDERWEYLEDPAQQLVTAALKDVEKYPENPHEKTLRRVRSAVADEDWVEGRAEMDWLVERLRVLLGW